LSSLPELCDRHLCEQWKYQNIGNTQNRRSVISRHRSIIRLKVSHALLQQQPSAVPPVLGALSVFGRVNGSSCHQTKYKSQKVYQLNKTNTLLNSLQLLASGLLVWVQRVLQECHHRGTEGHRSHHQVDLGVVLS
jgi:hypothetical protein